MVQNYKLCQNCNNALDPNITKCPYCGEVVWFDLSKGADWFIRTVENNNFYCDSSNMNGLVSYISSNIIFNVKLYNFNFSFMFYIFSW